MKAMVLTGIKEMKLQDWPEPSIENEKDVLLRVKLVGVCGSDVHYYETGRIGSQVVKYPYLVGHECSAIVEDVGTGVRRVKKGDEVVVEPAISCHECDQCKLGRENTCRNLRFLGTPGQGDGCLCEYLVMPEECCFPTHGQITLEQGTLCEPFTIGVYSVQQSHLSEGNKIAILGCGPIGLSCMAAAKAQNPQSIYMTDIIDCRVEMAGVAGATWTGNPENEDVVKAVRAEEPFGLDVVYECAGQQEALDEAVEMLRPGGTLMIIGIPRFERVSFVIDKIRRKEITLINVRRQNGCTQKAIDLIASGKSQVDFMITHRFKFADAKEAFDMVAEYSDGVVKALIEI